MDYKKIITDTEAVTRNLNDFDKDTENIYETLAVISMRANQISTHLRKELLEKIEQFQPATDNNLDEFFENREQIELAKFYEQLPKPTLMAIYEFLNDRIEHHYPEVEDDKVRYIHPDEVKEKEIEASKEKQE